MVMYKIKGLPLFVNMVKAKILNPVGQSCPSFSMEQDIPPSCPVLTYRTKDVPGHSDQDVGMLAGRPCPNTWDGTSSQYPAGHPAGT